MTYKTLMVHLELGHPNAGLLKIAGDLAERFQAGVIGIAACQPFHIAYGDGYVSGDILEEDRVEIDKEIKDAETEFRAALQARADTLEWRSAVVLAPLSDYLAREARSADLAITSVDRGSSMFDSSRHVFTSDFVMRVGRPVLIVPPAVDRLKLQRVVVCWKDSRETRRAVLDALPLLKQADRVTVVEIAAGETLASARLRLGDVIGWLKRHGVVAEPLALPSTGDDVARLATLTDELAADVVVAGAYGHSRLREWVLGGVTHDLLLRATRCSLVSH